MTESKPTQESLWCVAGLLLLAAIAVAAFRFTAIDRLATFGDDSVSYLLLAQCWSPWHATSAVIQEACAREHYPPLFPMVLAVFGASHDFLLAHRASVILFLSAVVALFFFVRQHIRWTPAALLIALLFGCAPLTWTQMLGINSENLFILLSLAALIVHHRLLEKREPDPRGGLLLGLIVGAMVLTRAIGIGMAGALVAAAVFGDKRRRVDLGWVPFLTAAAIGAAGLVLRTTTGDELYVNIVRIVVGKALVIGVDP